MPGDRTRVGIDEFLARFDATATDEMKGAIRAAIRAACWARDGKPRDPADAGIALVDGCLEVIARNGRRSYGGGGPADYAYLTMNVLSVIGAVMLCEEVMHADPRLLSE